MQVGVGRINAITGKRLHGRLNRTCQNYLVVPDQPWLDGITSTGPTPGIRRTTARWTCISPTAWCSGRSPASSYTECGLPWFALYDEEKGDVAPSGKLAKVKSVKQMDKKKGFAPQPDDGTVAVGKGQVKELKLQSTQGDMGGAG